MVQMLFYTPRPPLYMPDLCVYDKFCMHRLKLLNSYFPQNTVVFMHKFITVAYLLVLMQKLYKLAGCFRLIQFTAADCNN